MQYTSTEGMKMSKLALGTANYGAKISKEAAYALMDRFFACGGNVLDTARCYSDWVPGGANASETTIGQYLKERGLRERAILSTKGGHPPMPEMEPPRINKEALTKDIDASLHYLNTDYIDIYYLHRDDKNKDVGEIMPVLHEFVKSGKARVLGVSNWTASRIEEANRFAIENGLTPFRFSQPLWSYATLNAGALGDKTLYPMDAIEYAWYRENRFNIMAYSSQAQGFFSIFAEKGLAGLKDSQRRKYINESTLKRCEKVMKLSGETGLSPTAISLNYLIYNRVNTVSIIGPSRMASLEDSLRCFALSRELAAELFDEEDEMQEADGVAGQTQ